jgi:hypothetical protein
MFDTNSALQEELLSSVPRLIMKTENVSETLPTSRRTELITPEDFKLIHLSQKLQILHMAEKLDKTSHTFTVELSIHGARGSIVVKALCYKPEGRGFDTRQGEFLNLPNPSGRTRPWGLLIL